MGKVTQAVKHQYHVTLIGCGWLLTLHVCDTSSDHAVKVAMALLSAPGRREIVKRYAGELDETA